MKPRIDRLSQGCFVRMSVPVAWREVVSGSRGDVLARDTVYNARAIRAGDALEVCASLPPMAEIESARRTWLVSAVRREARAIGSGRAIGTTVSKRAQPSKDDVAKALESVRTVVDGKRWRNQLLEDGHLEIAPRGLAARLVARPNGVGVLLGTRIPLHGPADPGPLLQRAIRHAALGLNARFAFARLRVLSDGPINLSVEHQLPAAELSDDEIDHALEGVRYAAVEATQAFETLRHPAVFEEYAAVNEFAD